MNDDRAHSSAADGRWSQEAAFPRSSLQRLRTLLLEEGGPMRSLVADPPVGGVAGSDRPTGPLESAGPDGPTGTDGSMGTHGSPPPIGPAQLAASGPRVDGRAAEYELLVEAIYEGYLLHYHAPRVVRPPEDDLGLLAGDCLYALGLARLVKLGDVEAVAELADVITLSALAHGSGKPKLAAAVWTAGARAVGWGATPHHERAKALTRAGSPDALEAMRSLASA
ncbi:MAG TPA: hypothetical protein VFV03_09275 [Solirubrobacteraceae bacterium]|nr:hypothetical protein [Solirubrobacteraceae bacterium]